MGETAAMVGLKTGLLGALSAYFMADTHVVIVLIVGVIGGVVGYYKEVIHLEVKSTYPRMLSEFFVTIPVGVSLALLVSEIGSNFYPMKYGWIAVSFIIAIHAKVVLKTLTPMAKDLALSATTALSSIFKKKG